ncbi:hypothetical protein H8D30_02455 [bacterium]|nr:hypothetical protein [bacterium]
MFRVGFAGSDGLACHILSLLPQRPDWVLTRPPAKAGRGLGRRETEVSRWATEKEIPIHTFSPATHQCPPCDLLLVVSYGNYLPPSWLNRPLGTLNFHPSDLPRWRGAAPIQRALMAGEERLGACWIELVEEWDAGPVLIRGWVKAPPLSTGGWVKEEMGKEGVRQLRDIWDALGEGTAVRMEQEGEPTWASRITAEDREVVPTMSAPKMHHRIRALDPSPGARMRWKGSWLGLRGSKGVVEGTLGVGELASRGTSLLLGTGDGVLSIGRVHPAGKREMDGAEFLRGQG